MTTYTVIPAGGGNYSSLNAALEAVRTGAITDVAGHIIRVQGVGTEPASWSKTGVARNNPITIKPFTPAENGGTPVDLKLTKSGTFTNMPLIWDATGAGRSRFRFRGLWDIETGCDGWSVLGDRSVEDSGPAGTLDGDEFFGNAFIQYGMMFNRIVDDGVLSGFTAVMRKSGETTGTRAYNGVPCLHWYGSKGNAQSRPGSNWLVEDGEVAYWATDGIQINGLKDSTFRDLYIHDLFPVGATLNEDHIDGVQVIAATRCVFDRIEIGYVLYQGMWVKNTLTSTFVTNNALYSGVTECRFSNLKLHHFGGANLTGRSNFDPSKIGDNGATLGSTGGTAMGVTNVEDCLIENCVAVDAFNGAGLEYNWDTSFGVSEQTSSRSQMRVDIINNVFKMVVSESGSGKTQMSIGDSGFQGTWKNNLQLVTNTNASYRQVPDQTGDLARGTSPQWTTSDLSYRPLTGSPLIDAGYDSTISTGITKSTTDYDGTTWTGSRNIGLYESAGSSPTLNAATSSIAVATVNVGVIITAADSTFPTGETPTYLWAKQSGTPGVTFSSTSVMAPTVTIDAAGAVTIRLTVSTVETPGTTDTADLVITASDPTDDPIVYWIDGGYVTIGGVIFNITAPDTAYP